MSEEKNGMNANDASVPELSYVEDRYGEPDEPITQQDDEPTGPDDYPTPTQPPGSTAT